jgi:hypothetical protein
VFTAAPGAPAGAEALAFADATALAFVAAALAATFELLAVFSVQAVPATASARAATPKIIFNRRMTVFSSQAECSFPKFSGDLTPQEE